MATRDPEQQNKLRDKHLHEDSTLVYDTAAMVALQKISDYLEKHQEEFEEASQASQVAIHLHEYGVIDRLRPSEFKLTQFAESANPGVDLSFHYLREETAVFQVPRACVTEESLVRQLRDDGLSLLSSRAFGHLGGSQKLQFEIKGDIPAHVRFAVDNDQGILHLVLTNIAGVGKEAYVLQPQQVDTQFLAQLGRLLMGRRNVFLQEMMSSPESYPLSMEAAEEESVLVEKADVIDFEPLTLTGKREIVLSYRDMALSFDRYRPECRMGRKYPADIQIRSRYVSRAHARVYMEGKQFVFEDHSANGSFVKFDGKEARFLHQETLTLRGTGVISLGVSIASAGIDLIRFEVS